MEVVSFVDSFDHDQGWLLSKYLHNLGSPLHAPGPYHGDGVQFPSRGRELGAAQLASAWDSGAWSANVSVGTGFTGSGEVALLAPCWWENPGTIVDFPHHWLTVDSSGTLRVRRWPELPAGPPATTVIAQSAAGALPLGEWVGLEYRTQIRADDTRAGVVQARVNGVEVVNASGLVTTDPQRAVVRADYFRFGHLQTTTGDTGGVGGLGSGAENVTVLFDDICQRSDTVLGTALLPWWDVPGAPHRVLALPPTGPGLYTEFSRTGGTSNWGACVDANGFTSYVSRGAVASAAALPVDLYASAPAPTFVEAGGAALFVWGLAGTDDFPGPYTATLHARDGAGAEYELGRPLDTPDGVLQPWHYVALNLGGPTGLTNAGVAGLQIGWGGRTTAQAPLNRSMRGTQVCAELWYRPGATPPPGGAQHWSVGWVP